jgi:trehalose/maltose hydrolase-like predicted phosphorylase/hydroxymethylpyrimidine pyrophosphatase-like HAD family hydrolase
MNPGILAGHRYRLVAFDWDGTAVSSRTEQPRELAQSMQRLLDRGVTLVVITGTNAANVSGQIAPLLTAESRSRLYLMVNRGSEVYSHSPAGELDLVWRRDATAAENAALDATAADVAGELLDEHGIKVEIISNRLNRRKIDLIPTPEWADPPKARIGELLQAVEERLAPLPGGIGAAIDLTSRLAREHGLPDARITSDVKHIELGLTDKSDSIAFLMRRLAPLRAIRPREIVIAGDEFGPIAGFEGSDYRMVTRLAAGATIISVGNEPNGVPPGVIHLTGGPKAFIRLLDEVAATALDTTPVVAPIPAVVSRPAERDGWQVVNEGYDMVGEASRDTLFALTNGHMGVRGSTDEAGPGSSPAAYVAGLFDGPGPGVEDLVVIPDWVSTGIVVAGREFAPWAWKIVSHRRRLDLAALRFERELVCEDPDGRRLRLWSERLVSLAKPQLAGVRLRLTLEDGPAGRVELRAGMRAREQAGPLPHVEAVAAGGTDGTDMLHTRTSGGRVAVDVAQVLRASLDGEQVTADRYADETSCGRLVELELAAGQTIQLERHIGVHTERERALPAAAAAEAVTASAAAGWDALLADHHAAWAAAWARCDVEIEGDPKSQIGVRFAIAQMIAVAPTADSGASIAAKGLTGEGYKGHVFWDTDIFLLPFYAYTLPEVARRLLTYRVDTLPAALRHAQDAGLQGAWFAWESAATGEDVTPDFVVGPGGRRLQVLTGKQEIHVVSDVAWAVDAYLRSNADSPLLDDGGADLVLEAARFYATRGIETDRGYEIHTVIGPDELHEGVDNSAYTNVMGAWTMRRAAELVRCGVADAAAGEAERWIELADRMLVLRNRDGLIEQHEGFLELPQAGRGPEDRSELAWQRDRMDWRDVKQADVVMLMAVLEPLFTEQERLAHYLLYEPLTRHLSSLSEAVHSLVARRVDLHEAADEYLARAIAIDLYDSRGNRPDGMHMATQGGVWQAVVLGCGGIRADSDGPLRIDPRLPPGWTGLRFSVTHRGAQVTITLRHDQAIVEVDSGSADIELPGFTGTVSPEHAVRLHRVDSGWRIAA